MFICLNSVFSSEPENVPNYRKYRAFGKYGEEAFRKFHDYYYQKELLEKINQDYQTFDFKKFIKDSNEEELKICFGWSEKLTLKNKFVKMNLVEFIRYSPLYFQSVIEEIKAKPIFKKYLYRRWLSLIIGSGLFTESLLKK